MGVWIETSAAQMIAQQMDSHTLYGCVDWNTNFSSEQIAGWVTPCMGVWIETIPNF